MTFSERIGISATVLHRLEVEAGPCGDVVVNAEDDDAAHDVPAAVRTSSAMLPFGPDRVAVDRAAKHLSREVGDHGEDLPPVFADLVAAGESTLRVGRSVVAIAVDANGAMLAADLERVLALAPGLPTIVCCQAGNVNTGAIDPTGELAAVAHAAGAWLHVDGAFGLWAGACRKTTRLVGLDQADSWSTDAHKWLNVPYDCGIVICRHHQSHRAAMTATASYLVQAAPGTDRDPVDWNPEFSRRARGVPVYAALASLGRDGIEAIIERCCAHARRFAEVLGAEPGIEVLNDVVLNQVLLRFLDPSGRNEDHDARTRAVIARVQDDGTCWLGGSTWRNQAVMRISVSNYATTDADVEASIAAISAASAADLDG